MDGHTQHTHTHIHKQWHHTTTQIIIKIETIKKRIRPEYSMNTKKKF